MRRRLERRSTAELVCLFPVQHATSLGGVESLLEHRLGADPTEDPCLVRVSVGLEEFDDLRSDLRTALKALLNE
jgi:cystathionine beta-lyase/cystathionine gamma-synthase